MDNKRLIYVFVILMVLMFVISGCEAIKGNKLSNLKLKVRLYLFLQNMGL